MNFKLRSTILGWLCIFIATWVSAAPPLPSLNASKFKYGLLEKIPTSVARFFPAALPKPLKTQASIAANTVQWTGALSTDWNTAGNWTSVSGTPSLPPKKGSITGDHVIIPNVSGGSGNFPVITIDSARARSITLQAGASLTINSGGKLEVVGSDTDGFTNEGVFTNKGTILVDSAYNDAFVNKLNAQIINQGQLTLQKGFGNRLLNYGSITNTSGNFNVLDGVDTAFINYPTGSVINNATFSVNGGNNLRLYNRGAISNKSSFTVGGATAGHSFVNAVGASLTNEGTFQINGGFASQMINYSNIDNLSGSMTFNGGAGNGLILLHNLRRIFNKSGATLSLSSGQGTILRNDSIFINEGTCSVQGGSGSNDLVYNGPGDTIRNSASFTISGGSGNSLVNYGILENLSSTITINGGGNNSTQLHNKHHVFNRTGATISISSGSGYSIRNDSTIINDGTITISGGGWNPTILNGVGDTILTKGAFTSSGGGVYENDPNPNRVALDNKGYIEFHNNFFITNQNNKLIRNAGTLVGKPSGSLKLEASGDVQLYNTITGKVILEGAASFKNGGKGAVVNQGYYKQLTGTLTLSAFGKAFFSNYNYLELDVDISIPSSIDSFMVNKDSLILGPNMQVNVTGLRNFIYNTGYLLNQADLRIEQIGNAVLINSGTFVNEQGASIWAKKLPSGNPAIWNQIGSKFFNHGDISLFDGVGIGLENKGSWTNLGKLKLSNLNGYSSNNAIVNSDTLINEGIIELDTLNNEGIENSKYFRNSRNGEIYADFVRKNGIYNTGDVYNFGEIWMARDTGIGKAGIYNNKLFDNCGVINIGAKGPLFGGGIVNDAAGVFNNGSTAHIVIKNADSTAILNKGTAFTNGLCALIEVGTPIVDVSNSFTNYGIIVQNQDTSATLVAYITTNAGTIYDLDPESFNITSNPGSVLNSLPMGGVSASSISFTTSTPQLCPGETAKFVVEATCPVGPFDLVIGYNGKDTLVQNYTSGDTIRIKFLTDAGFVLKSVDVDGQGQVEKDIPALEITANTNCCPLITASIDFLPFLCKDSTIVLSSTVSGATLPISSYNWTQSGAGSVLITNNNNGTATAKGVNPGKVYIEFNVVDANGCSALSNTRDSLVVLNCSSIKAANDSPSENSSANAYMIGDPCTCKGDGLFDETVWVEPTLAGETWTVFSIAPLRTGGPAPQNIAAGDNLTYRFIPGPNVGIHEIPFVHVDSSGFKIVIEGPNPPGSQGNVFLTVDNQCYYPDVALNNVPVLVSPNAAPFAVTGTAANNAAGTGTFKLNGVSQTGASPAPTQLTINPRTLPLGLNTLEYSFDAGTAGSKNLNDPGCVKATTKTFQVANCGCQDVTVTLDANCQFVLTGNLVSDGNCNAGTVRVMDNNPSNGNIIDCAGVWTYGLFDAFGNIICWGKVTAEDKTAPAVVCTDFFNGTLDCFDVNYVLNNNKTIGSVLDADGNRQTTSPKPAATGLQTIINAEGVAGDDDGACNLVPPGLVADDIHNLGYPYFKDNCRTCGCRVTLKWSDKVVFYGCDSIAANGIYARIYREWVATDCNGMRSSIIQVIPFARPDVVLDNGCGTPPAPFSNDNLKFRGIGSCGEDAVVPAPGYDWVVQYNSCTPDKSLIKKIDVTPSFRSYFWNSKTKRDIYIDEVECNYSVSIKDTEFPICGGKGVKIDREMYIFDWCAGGVIDTIHILIKIGDFTPPSLTYAHHSPFEISTGPMDCTAAFPVTVAGIKSAFGVSITDNCAVANATVTVKTKDRYVKGILVAENTWDKVDYAIMNGMMIGVPVGTHRLIIDAFDGCYNAKRDSFTFVVKDKIAPVMKCDDQLHISLSNGNGYTTGYAQATAADLDEGSWDNCKLAWIKVRRNVPTGCEASFIGKGYDTNNNGKLDPLPADGDWTKADGFDINGDGKLDGFGETFILKGGKLMTPLQDIVEFFCCDLTALVTVELWGADIYGNTNFCWDELLIEDKVAPTCVAPWPLTVDCDEKCLEKIDNRKASALCFGDVSITSGNDCAKLDTVYTVEKKLKCGYGIITRKWALTKQTVKGPITINCSQVITVRPIHEYNICFPKDAIADCKTPIVDTVITDELGCDILAVNITDKRYDASNDECYKIFRTYTVINWCTFSDECADASYLGNSNTEDIFIVDRGTFGNYGKAPLYVLVRDKDLEDNDGEIYLSKDLIVSRDDEYSTFDDDLYYCDETEDYYQVFQYTQIIKVYDDVRPVVTGDPGKFCIREGADCLANLKMVINGKDNCSDKVTLETQFLMIAPGQTLDASKMIMYATPRWSTKDLGKGDFEINVANLPQGKHDLIVVVRDECGNLSVPTRIPFTVEDCKGPAPICINGLSTELMPDGNGAGMMAVWASDFVASKIYDCNGQGPEVKDGLKLVTKYSLNRVGSPKDKNVTGINLTCADKGKVILVELHAWDEAGNDDFCVTYVEVQDNRKVCPGSGVAKLNIAGKVATESSANLQGATITLSGQASMSATTTANGGYSFVSLATGGDFTVTPQLDKNHLNGVSTFDLVLIQKHILGIQALNSPYKMLAADVNNSKSITTLDLIALRKLILNIDQNFANNTSWRFVDAAYRFPDPNNPWSTGFPEVVSVNNLASNIAANFVAIKIGDVNASAVVSSATNAEVRTSGAFKLNTTEQSLKVGNEYQIAFSADDLQNIQGYQFALNLDQSKVELVDLEYGVAKAENFGIFKNEGLITISWNQAGLATATAKAGTLFTLVLRAKADAKLSSALSLNRSVSPEAYDQNNENLGIALNYGLEAIADGYELLQNTPNPFNGETQIGFKLPKATKATLSISDAKGALLYKVEGNYAKGSNQVTLKKEQLGASGVLYYTLETTEFIATKKMVILE